MSRDESNSDEQRMSFFICVFNQNLTELSFLPLLPLLMLLTHKGHSTKCLSQCSIITSRLNWNMRSSGGKSNMQNHDSELSLWWVTRANKCNCLFYVQLRFQASDMLTNHKQDLFIISQRYVYLVKPYHNDYFSQNPLAINPITDENFPSFWPSNRLTLAGLAFVPG